jgi:carboxymethylenebutenolidase
MNDYIKAYSAQPASSNAIIMLPDIWGQTAYANDTARQFVARLGLPVYVLDYFYQLTGEVNNFDPQVDQAIATGLMAKMTGQDFVNIFSKALEEISSSQPQLESIFVIGFCFGGRLAYLSGLDSKVKKIVSFYGAGAHTPSYFQEKTPIQALCEARNEDETLNVLSFYGNKDGSIPEADRQLTSQALKNSGINYTEKVYDAGHAYFQLGRDSYDQASALGSWRDLDNFIQSVS